MPILNKVMSAEGPIVDLVVSVSEPGRQALQSAGKPIPPSIHIRALVDTGASSTNVVASAIRPLGLSATGTAQVVTPFTGATPVSADEYDVSILILHPEMGRVFDTVPILECQELSVDYQALLGRDLLKHCSFFYNGPAEAFSLAF